MAMEGKTGKILIIDDDMRNIFALSAVLKSKGYSVVSALSAREGLNKFTDEVSIVLLDMMMPEMDGYETLSIIRDTQRSDIPVIAVTAQAMLGDREKCIEAGADGYISKPIDVDQLEEMLKKYMM